MRAFAAYTSKVSLPCNNVPAHCYVVLLRRLISVMGISYCHSWSALALRDQPIRLCCRSMAIPLHIAHTFNTERLIHIFSEVIWPCLVAVDRSLACGGRDRCPLLCLSPIFRGRWSAVWTGKSSQVAGGDQCSCGGHIPGPPT